MTKEKPNSIAGTCIEFFNGSTVRIPVPFDTVNQYFIDQDKDDGDDDEEKPHSEWLHIQHEGRDYKFLAREVLLFWSATFVESGYSDEEDEEE